MVNNISRGLSYCIFSNKGDNKEALFSDLLESATHLNLGVVEVLVNKLEQGFVCAAKIVLVSFHELRHCELSVDHVDGDLRVDDLANEIVEALVELLLVFPRNNLDVLDEVGEVQADEV